MPGFAPRAATTSSSSTPTTSYCRGSSGIRPRSSTATTAPMRCTGGRGTGTIPATAGGARERLSRLWVRSDETYEPPGLLMRFLEHPGSVPCLCAVMARRETLLRLGGFDESLQDLYEDQTLIAKLALHCHIRVDAAPGERYRQHEGSSTRRAIREGAYHPWRPNAARRRYIEWLDRYSAQLEAPPSRPLAAALARAARPYRHPRAYRVIAPAAHGWELLRDHLAVLVRPEPRA